MYLYELLRLRQNRRSYANSGIRDNKSLQRNRVFSYHILPSGADGASQVRGFDERIYNFTHNTLGGILREARKVQDEAREGRNEDAHKEQVQSNHQSLCAGQLVGYNLPQNIKKWRRVNKVTQEELAKLSGTTRASISAYEDGRCKPSFDLLYKLSYMMSVTMETLLYTRI